MRSILKTALLIAVIAAVTVGLGGSKKATHFEPGGEWLNDMRARITEKRTAALFPGIFVEGTMTHGEAHQAPSVPESAIIRLGASDVVFIRTSPSTFEARPVELGLFNGSRYEVRSGVEIEEEVVVQGVFFLKSVALTSETE